MRRGERDHPSGVPSRLTVKMERFSNDLYSACIFSYTVVLLFSHSINKGLTIYGIKYPICNSLDFWDDRFKFLHGPKRSMHGPIYLQELICALRHIGPRAEMSPWAEISVQLLTQSQLVLMCNLSSITNNGAS